MIKVLILANNGSSYYRDPRWPKYNVAYLSWFLSFTNCDVVGVLDQRRDVFVDKTDNFISNLSPDDITILYMSGVGGNYNGINCFLPYEYSSIDEGIINIDDILDKFKGKPVITFIDTFSPRRFKMFDFENCNTKNWYIAYNCSNIQWSAGDGTAFTGNLIRAMFGHSGTSLSNVLDSFKTAINKGRQTKGKKGCAYDSLHDNVKNTFLQGVLDNQDYQTQKSEPDDFPWIINMWRKLKGEDELDLIWCPLFKDLQTAIFQFV